MSFFGLDPLPRTPEAALRDADDKKSSVRLSAVHDSARHAALPDGSRAIAALVRVLGSDVSAEVRGAAAVALADAGAHGAVGALIDAVHDSHLHVRQMVLIALGELGAPDDERVLQVVERATSDEAPALRFQALIASNRLHAPFAEEALLRRTRDEDEEVRHVSLRVLEERATTSDLAVRPNDATLAAAKRALGDDALKVRLAAAILLGRAGEGVGASVIVEAVRSTRAKLDPEDEQAAVVLAGELAIRDATVDLERRAWGLFGFARDAFTYEARIALALLGDARARSVILRGLHGWTRDARTLAVVAAGRARLLEARTMIETMRSDAQRAEPSAVNEALAALEAGEQQA